MGVVARGQGRSMVLRDFSKQGQDEDRTRRASGGAGGGRWVRGVEGYVTSQNIW